jgi:uncharacterized glyoxalase superfamily protein PhnB
MTRHTTLTPLGTPVPELPVTDVERAQRYYRDVLGFEINWLDPSKDIGAVSRGPVVLFFRKRPSPFEPCVHWLFAEKLDATYDEMRSAGATIVQALARKPWGLRQFTIADPDGNYFHIYVDD